MSDLIRRADAIKALYKYDFVTKGFIEREIKAIPSVDIPHSDDWEKYSDKLWKNAYERGKADRPQGEWIGEADGYADGEFVYDTWYCSNCDYAIDDDEPPTWNFCPNCGADMRGEKDETD